MLYEYARKAIRKPFHLVGLDLVRRSRKKEKEERECELPPLFEDPLEALAYQQGGKADAFQQGDKTAAFECPIELTVKSNGLSYSSEKWDPLASFLREYQSGGPADFEGSVLEAYYDHHQPENAAEAFVGFKNPPTAYLSLQPHIFRLVPWKSSSPKREDESVRQWVKWDYGEHATTEDDWSFAHDGFHYHGPVSERKGRLEARRLKQIYRALKQKGYDRSHGHVQFQVLRRGSEYRFRQAGSGQHRTAAMAALGYDTVPGVFSSPHVVDINMVQYWPQVQRGLWTKKEAEAYFNYLFDFNSRDWAEKHGLL